MVRDFINDPSRRDALFGAFCSIKLIGKIIRTLGYASGNLHYGFKSRPLLGIIIYKRFKDLITNNYSYLTV